MVRRWLVGFCGALVDAAKAAPVYVNGRLLKTLHGEGLTEEFIGILEEYVASPLTPPGR